MSRVDELRRELEEIDQRIEAAALEEDYERFVILQARKVALPALIRRAEAGVVRAEIGRLEDQRREVVKQKSEVAARPLEEFRPPVGKWSAPGAERSRRAAVSAVAARERELGSRIAQKQRQVEKVLDGRA